MTNSLYWCPTNLYSYPCGRFYGNCASLKFWTRAVKHVPTTSLSRMSRPVHDDFDTDRLPSETRQGFEQEEEDDLFDIAGLHNVDFRILHRRKQGVKTPSPPVLSSYWSVPEQVKFRQLVSYYGRDFSRIADVLKTKSRTMVKYHYLFEVDRGDLELEYMAQMAEDKNARGESLGRPPSPVIAPERTCNLPKSATTGTDITDTALTAERTKHPNKAQSSHTYSKHERDSMFVEKYIVEGLALEKNMAACKAQGSIRTDSIIEETRKAEAHYEALKAEALYEACCNGDVETVKALVNQGVDVNDLTKYHAHPLQAASNEGHTEIVQILLDNGANVNAQSGYYGNALQAAARRGHSSAVQLLLNHDANVNAQGGRHGSAVQAASRMGHKSTIQVLLDRGADVNARGGEYGNALQAALVMGHESIVQMLLAHGADFNAQGGSEDSFLQATSEAGPQRTLQMLLAHGTDVDAQSSGNYTALMRASKHGQEKEVRMLLDNGADVNTSGQFGTALHEAVYYNHESVVQILLDRGADVNALGPWGTALQLVASSHDHLNVRRLLLDHGAIDHDAHDRHDIDQLP